MRLVNALVAKDNHLTAAKVYRKNIKQRVSWIAYRNNMARESPVATGNNGFAQKRKKGFLQKLREEQIAPLFSDTRRQQLSEVNQHGSAKPEISPAEKEINFYLTTSSVSLALTTAGGLFYPPLILLSVPLLFVSLKPFATHTYRSLVKDKQVGVAMVDLIGTGGCFVTGQFFATALACACSNFSRKLLLKTEDNSHQSMLNVFGEQPKYVWVLHDDMEVEILFDDLSRDAIVIIDAGQAIPIDGIIANGIGTVDQRTLTGESQPVEKVAGDEVFASTILLSGRLYVQVQKTGKETVAAQIGTILNSSDDFKSSIQSRGQTIVDKGAGPTLLVSALALPLLGVHSALAVLFAAIGYHMRLAAPIGVLNFLYMTSDQGILVKDGRCLELLADVDTVVFDKTGTLTEDIPTVGAIYTCDGLSAEEILTYAAAAEYRQTHPVAQAILNEAKNRGLTLPKIQEAEYELGYGLKASITSQAIADTESPDIESSAPQIVLVGSARYMAMCDIMVDDDYQKIEAKSHAEGSSFVYVAVDNQLAGAIELTPTIRPEALEITKELCQRNVDMYIISGDHQRPTQRLAQSLGIDHYFAEVLPQDKASIIEQLQNEGKSVCFVGDGINDSIALKTAQVGISMRGASTIATDTAGIVLMDGTLRQLIKLLDIADALDDNLNRSQLMTIVPGVFCMAGIFFFHFGLLSAIMIYNVSLGASIMNALLPMVKYQKEKSDQSTVPSHN